MPDSLYLVDTSTWVEVLRPGRGSLELRARIDVLLKADAVATTGMVRMELLGGTLAESEYTRLDKHLSALHLLPTQEERWTEAARLGFQLRRQGVTIPFTDLLIAVTAVHADATLIHCDRHFDLIGARSPLKLESYAQ
jgi:predicted nucleic acid-binding protein